MKRIFILIGLIIITSCSKNDPVNRCNFLLNVSVNASVNLNLPQYSQLQFTGTTVYIANQGNAGIYLSRIGDQFRAFDAADPSHPPTTCSLLVNTGGIGICGCEDQNEFSLLTGQPFTSAVTCGLKEYRVEGGGGNTLVITN